MLGIYCGAAAVILAVILTSSLLYEKGRSEADRTSAPDDWLFGRAGNLFMQALFKDRSLEQAADQVTDLDRYYKSCRRAGVEPDLRRLVFMKLGGLACMGLGMLTLVGTTFRYLLFHYGESLLSEAVPGAGLVFFFFFAFYGLFMGPQLLLNARAESRRKEMERQLFHFMDFLEAEIRTGASGYIAVHRLAVRLSDTLIGQEFARTFTEGASVGLGTWSESLYQMAETYNIPALTDAVRLLAVSDEKGTSITETLSALNEKMKSNRLADIQRRAEGLNGRTTIITYGFQMAPLLVATMLPTILTVFTGDGFRMFG